MPAADNKRRLLEFGIHWPPETFLRDRLEGLVRDGMKVTVATVHRASAERPPPGIELVPAKPSVGSGFWYYARGILCLARMLLTRPRAAGRVIKAARMPTAAGRPIARREGLERLCGYASLAIRRPDVLHIEWETVAVEYSSLAAALGCPTVISCHAEPILYELALGPRGAAGIGAAYAGADAVHCVADSIHRAAVRLGAHPSRTRRIYAGVDLELFKPGPSPRHGREQLVVLMVGHLRWMKGHEFALLAIARVAAAGVPVRLEIVGGDPSPETCEPSQHRRIVFAARKLALAERVHLAGPLERREVAVRMQQADVLLHPSMSEGLPTVLVEAMACELPVVATAVGGTSEAVRDGVEGLLIPPFDPAAAANALVGLWHDRSLRRRMGRAGRARVEAQFRLEHHIAEWIQLYGALAPA